VLQAYHAVVGGAICALLGAVLFCDLARLFLALAESVTEIVSRKALLLSERTSLSIPQHVSKMCITGLDLPAVHLALR
jgi:hypothetical protein